LIDPPQPRREQTKRLLLSFFISVNEEVIVMIFTATNVIAALALTTGVIKFTEATIKLFMTSMKSQAEADKRKKQEREEAKTEN
jgi:hypothetical protein